MGAALAGNVFLGGGDPVSHPPAVSLDASSVAFGSQTLNVVSPREVVTFKNEGDVTVLINSITLRNNS
jgi:hypothetical protein